MHTSSRVKFEAFLETYFGNDEGRGKRILDVGSRAVQGAQKSYNYRQSTDALGMVYTGIDFEEGQNVDVVPKNPYVWDELKDETFDHVVSGQAFEHNPFPWVTFCEIARVLKEGGIAFIIAPSAGPVHRWPYDAWRYYPDSWAGLCALSGLTATEIIREEQAVSTQIPGGGWMDSAVIATKPKFETAEQRAAFYRNLAQIVAPFKDTRYEVTPASINAGPTYKAYLAKVKKFKPEPKTAKPAKRAKPAKPAAAADAAARESREARALRRKRARRAKG